MSTVRHFWAFSGRGVSLAPPLRAWRNAVETVADWKRMRPAALGWGFRCSQSKSDEDTMQKQSQSTRNASFMLNSHSAARAIISYETSTMSFIWPETHDDPSFSCFLAPTGALPGRSPTFQLRFCNFMIIRIARHFASSCFRLC